MGSLQLDITMRGLTVLILLLVGLVDLGSSYTSIPDSVCHEKFGLDFCNCVQICNSLGECELVNVTNCPIEAPTQAPSPRTIPNVPMFPQDVRDVMMSVPKEMENRISWTTNQEEAIQAAQELGMIILEVCIAVK